MAKTKSKFGYGIKAGVNFPSMYIQKYEGSVASKPLGFQLGVTLDYNISKEFYLQSGLSFTTKGTKTKITDPNYFTGNAYVEANIDQKINLNYLQLPLMAGYKVYVDDNINIILSGGAYVAYGIGGKITETTKYGNSNKEKEKLDSFGLKALKDFDYGAIANIGVEFGHITTSLGYEIGIMDIGREHNTRNQNISIMLGYKF